MRLRAKAHLVLDGIHLRHVIGERHLHGNTALGALQGKSNVVCKGEHGVVTEFVGELQVGGLNDFGRDREHAGR